MDKRHVGEGASGEGAGPGDSLVLETARRGSCLSRIRDGSFGVAFVLSKEASMTSFQTMLAFATLEVLQMSSFPVSLVANSPSIKPVSAALTELASGAFSHVVQTVGFTTILTFVLAVAAVFVGLVAAVGVRFINDSPQSKPMLRLLRAMASLLTTVLFLPMAGVLMRVFVCESPEQVWGGISLKCEGSGHVVLQCFVGLVLLMWVATSLLVTMTLVDNNPASKSFSAKIHGRIDALVILIKLTLTFVWGVSAGSLNHGVEKASAGRLIGITVLMVFTGVLWMAAFAFHLPFMQMKLNAFIVATSSVYLWCSLTVLLTLAAPGAHFDPGLSITLGSIGVGIAAYMTTLHRIQRLSRLSMSAAKGSPALLELWGRIKLRVLLDDPAFDRFARAHSGPGARATGHTMALGLLVELLGRNRSKPSARSRRPPSLVNTHRRVSMPSRPAGRRDLLATVGVAPLTGASVGGKDDEAAFTASQGAAAQGETESARSTERSGRRRASAWESEAGRRHRPAVHHERLEKVIEGTELELALFCLDQSVAAHRLLIQAFPNSELAAIRTATFWQMYSPFLYPEMLALRHVARLNSGIDTQYHVFMRLKQTQGVGGNTRRRGHSSMNVIDRLMVEQQTKQIASMQQSSYRSTARLWQCLAEGTVDLKDVADAGMKLNQELNQLDKLFESVMQSGAASTTLMRNYATFLREQRSNPTQAMELMNKADRMDEAKSRRRGRTLRHCHFGMPFDGRLDENDERAAVMMVSGDVTSLGEVLQVSVGACRLLGARAPQELVGTTVHDIVPPPIREGHPALMAALSSQVTSFVLNHPQLLFITTLSGTIVPAWTRVGEAPPDNETAAPRFMAVMEPVISRESHLVVGLEGDDWRIFAGSASALETLGLGPELLRTEQEPIPATAFIPSICAEDCPYSVICASDGVTVRSGDHLGRARPRRASVQALPLGKATHKAGGFGSGWKAASRMALNHDAKEAERVFRLLQGYAAAANRDELSGTRGAPLPGTNSFVSAQSDSLLRVELSSLQDLASQPDTDTIIPIRARTKSGGHEWKLFVGNMEVVSRGGVKFGLLRWVSFESAAVSWQTLGARSLAHRPGHGSRRRASGLPRQTPPSHLGDIDLLHPEVKQQSDGAEGDGDSMLGALDGQSTGRLPGRSPSRLAAAAAAGKADESAPGEPMVVDPTGMVGASSLERAHGLRGEPHDGAAKPTAAGGRSAAPGVVPTSRAERALQSRPSGQPERGDLGANPFGAEGWHEGDRDKRRDGGAAAQEQAWKRSGSWSQASTGTSDTTRLARVLKAQLSQALPEVTRIRLVILAVTIICLVVGLLDIVWLRQTSDGLRGVMRGVVLSGQRMVTAQKATASLYYIVVTTAGIPVRVEIEEQRHLLELAQRMRKLNADIYLAGAAFGNDAAVFESQVPLPVVQLRDMAGVHGMTAELDAPPPPNTTHGLTLASAHLATFPCLSYEQCNRDALSFLAHTAFDYWLEAGAALHISSIGTGHELTVEEAEAAAEEVATDHIVMELSRDPDVLERQLAEIAAQEYVSSAVAMPLWQFTEYVSSTLDSIAHAPPEALGYFYRDLRDSLANDGRLINAHQETLELRATELSNRFPQVTMQLLVAGTAAFLVAATLQSVLLAAIINRIAQRTRKVLRLLLLVPRSTCRSMQGKATKRFQQLVAERDDSGFTNSSDSSTDSEAGSDSGPEGRELSLPLPGHQAVPAAADGPGLTGGLVPQHGVTGSELDRRLLGAQLQGDTNRAASVAGDRRGRMRHRRGAAGKRITASLRSHTDSSNFVCYHVSMFTAPTLLILVWLGTLAIYQAAQYQRLEELSHRAIIAALMSRRSFEYYLSMADTVLAEGGDDRLDTTLACQRVDRELLRLAQVFMFGGDIELPATGASIGVDPIKPSMRHYDLFVVDGCQGSHRKEECAAVEDGAMLAGLYTALHKMVHVGRRLISKLPQTQADPGVPLVYGFYPGPWQDLTRMSPIVDPHMTDALDSMLNLIEEEMLAALDQVQTVSIHVTIAFDVLMFVWVLVALSFAPKLARPLHSARGLLAVVPSNVRDGVQGLRLAVRDIASDQAMAVRSVDFEPSSAVLQSHDRSCCAKLGLTGRRAGATTKASQLPASSTAPAPAKVSC